MVTESPTYNTNHHKLSESWSGAMAAWNFVTTNAGGNPDGYDAEDRFQCAFNVRRPQLAAGQRLAIFKKRRKRKFAQSAQSKTFNFTRSDIGNINNINLNERFSKWGTARTFNNIHALTQIGSDNQTFDVDGNLTGSHASHTLAWDEAGMMKETVVPNGSSFGIEGATEYGYDADRKRVWKKFTPPPGGPKAATTVYVYAGPNCIAEYPAGTAAASPTQEYVYAKETDSLVLLVRGGGSDKYTITRNQQWSVTALAELASGTIVQRYTYDHFGKRTILESNGTTVRSTSSYAMHYGYTSRRHDAETDLMYFRARYYDPHTAEFLSPDPLEYVDGMSLFRGYFLGADADPSGQRKVCCELGYEGNKDNTWVREVECQSGRSAHSCCSNVHGTFYSWTVYGTADKPCDRVSNPTSTIAGGTACCAFLIAVPSDPTDVVGTPAGIAVGLGAGIVWLCATSEILKLPPISIDIDVTWPIDRPVPDGGRGWTCTCWGATRGGSNYPDNCPNTLRGTAWGKTQSEAAAAAKKKANHSVPGCWAGHLQCDCVRG